MSYVDNKRIGEILVGKGMVKQEQVDEALREQDITGRLLGEILSSHDLISDEEIARVLSEELSIAFVKIEEMEVEPEVLEFFSQELCELHKAMPIYSMGNNITVAMANPTDQAVIKILEDACGHKVKPVIAPLSSIQLAIAKHFHSSPQAGDTDLRKESSLDIGANKSNSPSVGGKDGDLKAEANLAPVINLVNEIITKAVQAGASDIHFEPERKSFNCRYRVDGVLFTACQIPIDQLGAIISRIKIMSDMDIAEKRLPQDGKLRMIIEDRDIDMRISSFPTIHGENIVIRILDRTGGLLELKQLGLAKTDLSMIIDLIKHPYGIILVTGPTGSGKTTTLYASLNNVNTPDKNIMTLEDPVEYELPYVRQSQVNVKAGLTFARGLRSILRQDPDIIMIGEIRDKETADIAVHAALTGHLVLSTLHTNDSPSAMNRLIDMGVEPFLVSSSINGIIAQRLLRMLCPHCKKRIKPSADVLKRLNISNSRFSKELSEAELFEAVGCTKCNRRGYVGRTGIYEVLVATEDIKQLIAMKRSVSEIRDAALKNGMRTLREAALEKALIGVTSVSEVLRVTDDI